MLLLTCVVQGWLRLEPEKPGLWWRPKRLPRAHSRQLPLVQQGLPTMVRGCLLMASPRHSVFPQSRQPRPKHKHSKRQAEAASLRAQPWGPHLLPSCCPGDEGPPDALWEGNTQGREHWGADHQGHRGKRTATGGQRRAVTRQDSGRYSSHTRGAAGWVPGAVGTEGCLPRGMGKAGHSPPRAARGACLAPQVTRGKMEVVLGDQTSCSSCVNTTPKTPMYNPCSHPPPECCD